MRGGRSRADDPSARRSVRAVQEEVGRRRWERGRAGLLAFQSNSPSSSACGHERQPHNRDLMGWRSSRLMLFTVRLQTDGPPRGNSAPGRAEEEAEPQPPISISAPLPPPSPPPTRPPPHPHSRGLPALGPFPGVYRAGRAIFPAFPRRKQGSSGSHSPHV